MLVGDLNALFYVLDNSLANNIHDTLVVHTRGYTMQHCTSTTAETLQKVKSMSYYSTILYNNRAGTLMVFN